MATYVKHQLKRALRRFSRVAYYGHIDGLNNGIIRGWAYIPSKPDVRPLVDVFVSGVFNTQSRAYLLRRDLLEKGFGDGYYGFEAFIGKDIEISNVEAYFVSRGRPKIDRYDIKASRVRKTHTLESYLNLTLSKKAWKADTKIENVNLKSEKGSSPRTWDRLFEDPSTNTISGALGRSLTAYLNFRLHKDNLNETYYVADTMDEYKGYLKDYLLNYGTARRPLKIPISSKEIAYLNEGPSFESPFIKTNVQLMFSENFQKSPTNNSNIDHAIKELYIWAIYESRLLGFEDCLVPESSRELLSKEIACHPYPLSTVMKIFLYENTFLQDLDIATQSGREQCYFCIMIFAVTSPHIISYMPKIWVDRLLDSDDNEMSHFDKIAAHLTPQKGFDSKSWREAVSHTQFDLEKWCFKTVTSTGNRLSAAALSPSRDASVDVQIIAPFSRQLGISQSAYTLATAVHLSGVSYRMCDFAQDYPNASLSVKSTKLEPPGAARINILHLNLEELPSVIAYMPDVFTNSHLVAFPYLELPAPNATQQLGLRIADEIWTASQFNKDALSRFKATYRVGSAVRSLQPMGKSVAREYAYRNISSNADFVFLAAGDALSGAHRKNLLGVLRAFVNAFQKSVPVKLVIKIHSSERVLDRNEIHVWNILRSAANQDNRIILIDKIFEERIYNALIEGADCFVSLHRAEGFGFHLIESMALGTPVITTAYSGNMDFCTKETCLLIPADIVNVKHGYYPRARSSDTWGEPDIKAAILAMRLMYSDERVRDRLMRAAKLKVDLEYSMSSFTRRIVSHLGRLGV